MHTARVRGRNVPIVVWVGLAAFVGLGLPEATLGVTWPSIRVDLDQPLPAIGLLLGAITVGYLPTSAVSGRITARFGAGWTLSAAAGIFAIAMACYVVAPSFPLVVVGSLLSGIAAGIIDPGVNTHFALNHGTRAMNLLHACFGIGATSGPFIATAAIGSGGSWRLPYGVYLLVQVALIAGFVTTRRRWSTVSNQPHTRSETDDRRSTDSSRPPSRAVVVLSALVFFVYTGLEVGGGVLAFTMLSEGRGLSGTAAGLWATSYWAGITAGRAALGVAGGRLRPEAVVRAGSLAAVVAAALIVVDPGGVGAAGFPLLGLALAGIFPSLVLLTPTRVGRSRTATVIGVQFSVAAVGASSVPAVISLVAEHDLERIGLGLLVLSISVAVLDLVATRLSSPDRPRPSELRPVDDL